MAWWTWFSWQLSQNPATKEKQSETAPVCQANPNFLCHSVTVGLKPRDKSHNGDIQNQVLKIIYNHHQGLLGGGLLIMETSLYNR